MSEPLVDDELVAVLARSAVAQAAPEELPLFRATSEAYFENPDALEAQRSKDEMLGFGVGDALVLLTPVALAVSRDVLSFVLEQLRSQAREHGKEAIDRLVSRLLDRDEKPAPEAPGGEAEAPAGDAEPPDLTDEQLEEVRALAVEKARQLKLAPDKAELLADSLVGSLATA
jgi:hypothetical protein